MGTLYSLNKTIFQRRGSEEHFCVAKNAVCFVLDEKKICLRRSNTKRRGEIKCVLLIRADRERQGQPSPEGTCSSGKFVQRFSVLFFGKKKEASGPKGKVLGTGVWSQFAEAHLWVLRVLTIFI